LNSFDKALSLERMVRISTKQGWKEVSRWR